jgi:hypothetical protein
MCPAVPSYVDAEVGGFFSNVQALFTLANTHTHTHPREQASKYFSFFTKKRNPCECFSCLIFPRLFSLMPKHVNLPSGHFLHMRMLNRFIFLPLSNPTVQNSCPNIYCLTMLCIYPHKFSISALHTLCTFRQSPSLREPEKKYRIYHYQAQIFLFGKRSTLFSGSLFALRVQFKEKFPIIFSPNGCYSTLESSKLNKNICVHVYSLAFSYKKRMKNKQQKRARERK